MNPQKKRRQDSEKQQLILQRNSQLHGVLLAALLAVVLLALSICFTRSAISRKMRTESFKPIQR